MIGIDPETELAYEGVSNYGHGIWPTPVISMAIIIEEASDWKNIPADSSLRNANLVFREDYFDPVTRIRRGRFYNVQGAQPANWWVHRHSVIPHETGMPNQQGRYNKSLLTFHPFPHFGLRLANSSRLLVVLGASKATTVWNVVSVEKTGAQGQDLVTLRARTNMALLPELLVEKLPAEFQTEIQAVVEKVVDGAHRLGGISLVDLCRDAAQTVLSAWLASENDRPDVVERDLGKVIAALPEERRFLRNVADTIGRLHSRGKSNEARRLGTRPVDDADAQLALDAFAFILRDLGWAR